ncbi:hypothetical protein GUA87_05050 [Sneathiella sp. P13V-1]|uniref:hypothetical protein n=1 Tax=Sneathiella sp. P13V-1 TaxID=2697366 RepID=UPI00187BA465|nr:hypothetical protein [Sneathiella sp. P13V-1]MBE7636201.1 hypothetical protein [Sneathiella sp. P13V-1]
MAGYDYDEEDWDDESPDLDEFPTLVSVARFNKLLVSVPWFSAVGTPLGADVYDAANEYIDLMGFTGSYVAPVESWEDAAYAAQSPDLNSMWWEAEEQMRAGLTMEALELIPEADLTMALTHIASTASPLIEEAIEDMAEEAGIVDAELIRAAMGSALQACHQAALVLASGQEDTHPFALKYKLFEKGHWPIAISGNSFNIF